MYAGEDADDGRTAFRRAEKRYKLHREQTFRRRRGRLKSAGFSTRAVDLSDVLDLARFRAREATDPAVRRVDVDVGDATRPDVVETYRLETHPGLVLVPGALTVPEQRRWLKAAVTTLCDPPREPITPPPTARSRTCGRKRAARTRARSSHRRTTPPTDLTPARSADGSL